MNENGAWDGADSANYDLNEAEEKFTHGWTPANLLPQDCLWDEVED